MSEHVGLPKKSFYDRFLTIESILQKRNQMIDMKNNAIIYGVAEIEEVIGGKVGGFSAKE